jgi:DNA-binding response OmpR family regulator
MALISCGVHTSSASGSIASVAKNKAERHKTKTKVSHLAMETILVLDSSGTCGSLTSLLLGIGYDVRSVTGGVILDALLTPGRSSAFFLGFQKETIPTSAQTTCLAIRQTNPDIPLIVLGPSIDITTKVGLLKFGADDYIEEPFDADELVARLRSHIRRRKLGADRVHL